VVLTSADPDNFRWRGLFINNANANSSLDFTEISYGGESTFRVSTFVKPIANLVIGKNTSAEVNNCVITNRPEGAEGYGIFVDDSGSLTGDGNTFDIDENNVLN
jgi:hypothetical protein